MKILFLSHYFSPHIGGVEKHILFLSKELIKKGNEVTILTYKHSLSLRDKFDPKLKSKETINGINVIRFTYPNKKFIGLFHIWYSLWIKRSLFFSNDIIHIHDVFIWYLPFRFLFPNKKVFTTIHGLEWGNPFSK